MKLDEIDKISNSYRLSCRLQRKRGTRCCKHPWQRIYTANKRGFKKMVFTLGSFVLVTVAVAFVSWLKTKGTDETSKDGYFLGGRSLSGMVIFGSLHGFLYLPKGVSWVFPLVRLLCFFFLGGKLIVNRVCTIPPERRAK